MKIFLIITLINASFCFGQVIEGSVSDKITGIRLSGVNIIIVDKNAGSSTDSNGEFSLDTKDLNSSQIIQFKHI